MRIRFKPYARPELTAWEYFIDQPASRRGEWSEAFQKNIGSPLRLELGCGKGAFISQLALKHPDHNYIAIDVKSEMLVLAKRKIEAAYAAANRPIDNVLLTAKNIERIEDIFSPQDPIEHIYINFCNPWHKSGHSKHRLTHPRQLIKYREFLSDGGKLFLKTDDAILFGDSLRYFPMAGFSVIFQSLDLYANEPAENIRTEHEQFFVDNHITIKACVAVKEPANLDKEQFLKMKDI